MSGKLLYSLTDETPGLQKQIGCMNGIFRQFLSGRRINGHNHKRLPPGQSANNEMQPNSATQKSMLQEENLKDVKEKQSLSVESSWASFSSSSCSSTFSSVDCNKTAQTIFPETPFPILSVKQPNSSLHLGQQSSLALRDVVKDSMYREARGLSVKTMTTEEGRVQVMKHIDSPRPLKQSNSVQPIAAAFEGSTRVVGKDGSLPFSLKDAPRFSYDGRDTRDTFKSTIKLKELPRLSLDSRSGSIRSSASESRSNCLLSDLRRENGNSSQIPNLHQEPGVNKRTSSVVAKLMGLEKFPDSISINQGQMMNIKPCPDEDGGSGTISRSSKIARESSRQDQVSGSPKVYHREPASPRSRNGNSLIQPTSSTRVALESVPWRQIESGQGSKKLASKYVEVPINSPQASHSVYGEIEKRFTELEFKKSGKDLRALKQILEAMQKTSGRVENKKDEQILDSKSPTSSSAKQQRPHSSYSVSPTTKGTNFPTKFESRITAPSMIQTDGISGLQKLHTRNSANNRSNVHDKQPAKDITPRNNSLGHPSSRPRVSMDKKTNARTFRSNQTSKGPESGERFTISGTVSPRLQQKKNGMEKESQPTTPSSDLSRSRRQFNKQSPESVSPRRKSKSKSANLKQGDAQLSEVSSETRSLSHQGDTASLHSESNTSLASDIETGITSKDRSNEINGTFHQIHAKERKYAARSSEDKLLAEFTTTPEQPSPVSVLDAMFYIEESPSPVKKMSSSFTDAETSNFDEAEWHPEDLGHLLNRKAPNLISQFSSKKLENIKLLIHKLKQLNSTSDEATTCHIASLCESTNPNHRYITEILLASGLLKDLGSSSLAVQLQPSGNVINPNLFHVLEQTKRRTELANENRNGKIAESKFNGKIQRKQIFDVVNEILFRKLAFEGSYMLGGRTLSGQKLLKELCSEICHLQANPDCLDEEDDGLTSILSADMRHQAHDWTDNCGEIPGLVLDIERLIFKDLISEIVSGGEAAGLQDRARKHCRQLFTN